MANYFGTLKEWSGSSAVYPEGDYLVALPDNFSGTSGIFPFKVSDGKTAANKLPYAPNRAAFNVIFHTDIPAGGSGITQLTGPITAGPGAGSVATTVTPNAIENTMLDTMPAGTLKGNDAATPTDPADLDANRASTILDGATDPFVRTSALPPAGGDVVGPASSTDNNVPQWNGTTGKLLKDGLGTSTGGNGAADAGKVVLFGSHGQIQSLVDGDFVTIGISATLENGNGGNSAISGYAENGVGGSFVSENTVGPALECSSMDGTYAADLFHAHNTDGDGLEVQNDGGMAWTSATGAQTTATNLPVFASGTKGVVPAAPAIVGTTKFLREDGTWVTPADRFCGSLSADQNLSSTTLTDVTSMSGFSLAASAEYHIAINALVATNATTVGILMTVNASAAVTSLELATTYPTSATAWTSDRISALQGGVVPTTGPGLTVRSYNITGKVVTQVP